MQRNIVQVNRHGEIEVSKNEIQYKIPVAKTDVEELHEIEDQYAKFAQSLMQYDNYLFAQDIQSIRHQFVFTFELEEMRAYHYIRQLTFEDQVYYFQSLVQLAHNDIPILWDKKALYLDLTDQKVKALIFEFPGHPIYSYQTTLDGLIELILLALTNLKRVMGKPRKTDFIRQEDEVLRFAENIIHSKSIEEIEAVIQEQLVDIEKEKELQEEERKEKKNNPIYAVFSGVKEKRQEGKENKTQAPKPKKEKTRWIDSKYTYIGAAALGAFLLIASMGGAFESTASEDEEEQNHNENIEETDDNNNNNNAQQTSAETTDISEEVIEEELAVIYRELVISDDPEQALIQFEDIGYDRLPSEDQEQMLHLYRETDQAAQAIELEDDYANVISADRNEEEIAAIAEQSDHPRIQYVSSYLQGEWANMQTLAEELNLTEEEQTMLNISGLELELEELADDGDADDDDIESVEGDIAELRESLEG